MKEKYQKPLIRNLGDVLPTAHGNCSVGEAAGQNPGEPSACRPMGSLAQGSCNPGQFALGACVSTGGLASTTEEE